LNIFSFTVGCNFFFTVASKVAAEVFGTKILPDVNRVASLTIQMFVSGSEIFLL
jgi:hypothetical protein